MTHSHTPTTVAAAVDSLMPRACEELRTLVHFRSVADARVADPAECENAAQWVADAFTAEGVPCHLAPTPDGSSLVLGHHPAPAGRPTVLLYAHYDVQPPLDESQWRTPPFELTEGADGRLFGRGAADSKGNIIAHLTALRVLRQLGDGNLPVGIRVLIEGSEEQGGAGLDAWLREHPDDLDSDVFLIQDAGNAALGLPTLTTSLRGASDLVVTVEALTSQVHSGQFGGAAPDALAALIAILASLRDANGDTVIDGVTEDVLHGTWPGVSYDVEQFRTDAGILDGVDVLGSGAVADQLWARPAVTVLGIDAPPVVGSSAAIQPKAAARLNLRIPTGADPNALQEALIAHLRAHAPWGVHVQIDASEPGWPFRARTDGSAFGLLSTALAEAFGRPTVTSGIGGSIPLCTTLEAQYPAAEILLLGVEEPQCLIHAPNESVAPSEIAGIATAETLFLSQLGH